MAAPHLQPSPESVGAVGELGRRESAVMERLWASNTAATVRDVLEEIRPGRVIAYTTVMSVMENLHCK